MGLFKGMKDLANVTKQAKELQDKQQREAGYKPGMRGQFQQMGAMLEQANQQLTDLTGNSGDRERILAEGISGEGVIVGHGVPARGAQWFNMNIDMEIHVSGRSPYRVNNEYMVPAGVTIGAGVRLPVKVDSADPAKIAIDWDRAQRAPAEGEVRPAGGSGFAPAPAPAAPAPSAGGFSSGSESSGEDTVAQLERLAKLRDSGALTDAEFEQQKARILGG